MSISNSTEYLVKETTTLVECFRTKRRLLKTAEACHQLAQNVSVPAVYEVQRLSHQRAFENFIKLLVSVHKMCSEIGRRIQESKKLSSTTLRELNKSLIEIKIISIQRMLVKLGKVLNIMMTRGNIDLTKAKHIQMPCGVVA